MQQSPDYAASPLGAFPELAQMYATNFSTPLSDANTGAQLQQDQVSVENAKKAQAEAESRAAAFSDKNKYTVVQKDDGGYSFYGPDGNQVSAAQYANNTGQKLTDVLKDSQNPIDIRYIQDQQNLTKYLQAKANSKFDNKQKAIAQDIEGSVKKAYNLDLSQQNPQNLIKLMQANYPTIYGPNQDNAPGFSGSDVFLKGYGSAQSQAEANNPLGFYQPQGISGGLGSLKKR